MQLSTYGGICAGSALSPPAFPIGTRLPVWARSRVLCALRANALDVTERIPPKPTYPSHPTLAGRSPACLPSPSPGFPALYRLQPGSKALCQIPLRHLELLTSVPIYYTWGSVLLKDFQDRPLAGIRRAWEQLPSRGGALGPLLGAATRPWWGLGQPG